jgi:hypothetical protein
MDQDWSWKDLTVVAPVTASIFAFAYVVGYFYAFDIAWFAFFSFPEHLVFALRALPIAIGASVCFLIALRFSTLESRWKWLQGKSQWFGFGWVFALVVIAVYTFFSNHVGLATSFLLIAGGSYIYQKMPASTSRFENVLYWAITLMVLSLMTGFASGYSWKVHQISSMTVVYNKPDSGSKPPAGHIIFAGSSGVLFYDYNQKKVRLVRQDIINDIFECANPKCPNE